MCLPQCFGNDDVEFHDYNLGDHKNLFFLVQFGYFKVVQFVQEGNSGSMPHFLLGKYYQIPLQKPHIMLWDNIDIHYI